jgi:hypothetical protein
MSFINCTDFHVPSWSLEKEVTQKVLSLTEKTRNPLIDFSYFLAVEVRVKVEFLENSKGSNTTMQRGIGD